MKAYEIKNQPSLDSLTLIERPEPKPAHGQALVKIHAASLNYRDLLIALGEYGAASPRNIVPMSDCAGEVIAVGDGVTRFKVGDRVAGIFMQTYLDGSPSAEKGKSALGGAIDGVLVEYAAFDENGLVPIPEHLSFEEASTLPCAAVTAWHALITSGQLKAGESVLLEGTGGVSIFALQIAKMSGARVIITSSSDEKLERAKALGADETINYKTNPDWEKCVWELTNGLGVDHVVEVGGAGTLNKALKSVRHGGHIALIGRLTGGSGEINTALILSKNIRVQGIYVGSRQVFEEMNSAIMLHKIKPIVDKVFPFDRAHAAYEHLQSGQHFGKIVISLA